MYKYKITIRDLLLYKCTVEVIARNKKEAVKIANEKTNDAWESDFYKSLKPEIARVTK
jgi:hypothetical protein